VAKKEGLSNNESPTSCKKREARKPRISRLTALKFSITGIADGGRTDMGIAVRPTLAIRSKVYCGAARPQELSILSHSRLGALERVSDSHPNPASASYIFLIRLLVQETGVSETSH
jgi:hypothetical protein